MYALRIFVASLLLLVALVIAMDCMINGRSGLFILSAALALTLAYACWPKLARLQRRHQIRHEAEDDWIDGIDILEFLIEAPFRLIRWFSRSVYHFVTHHRLFSNHHSNHTHH